jgi:hypothetical protein
LRIWKTKHDFTRLMGRVHKIAFNRGLCGSTDARSDENIGGCSGFERGFKGKHGSGT